MFVDVRKLGAGQACRIAGYGHTVLGEEYLYDNPRFIREVLSPTGRTRLWLEVGDPSTMSEEELVARADAKMSALPLGIRSRYLYPGPTSMLAAMAAETALADAGWLAADLDAIIVATNTGRGYPSTADMVKLHLDQRSEALCFDLTEACSAGVAAIFDGWRGIRSGAWRRVLVIGAENALTLATPDNHEPELDNYKDCNLFGSAAFALAMEAAAVEQFRFFDQLSEPFDGQSEWVRKGPHGFTQDGRRVHEYIGRAIPPRIVAACQQAGIDPADVRHVFPHMPSRKTVDFFIERLRRLWPREVFNGCIHENIATHGNTSAASSGWLLARAKASGLLRPGDICIIWSFGSGMSAAGTAFIF
ncbi:MAG: hypothetical protein HYY50_01690 [Candidatus Kerfeldbacteria bacterium]|nr:hypothetical protein [Candidatus Kerfeldbacteria bacterium]